MNYTPNSTEVKQLIEGVLQRHFGCSAKEASRDQMYKATAITVKNILSDKRSAYKKKVNEAFSILLGLPFLPTMNAIPVL